MSREVRAVLSDAALRPVSEPDWSVVLRRGRTAARRRLALVAMGAGVVIAIGAMASSWIPRVSDPPLPDPAGLAPITTDEPPSLCVPALRPVTVYLRRDIGPEEIDRVGAILRRIEGVERVHLVDESEAYQELERAFRDLDRPDLPHHAFPVWFFVDARSMVAVRRVVIEMLPDAAVAEVDGVSRSQRRLLCAFQKGEP